MSDEPKNIIHNTFMMKNVLKLKESKVEGPLFKRKILCEINFKQKKQITIQTKDVDHEEEEESNKSKENVDIMAQQFKFIACLKIMMEELSTLATGFEVDGGLLR